MKHYNVTLDDNESSEEFSAFKKLDDFANAIVKKVNQHSMEGYGLDDNAAASPGRAFFEPAVGDATATTIEISEDIKGKPRDLPVSGAPGEPGNNDVARKIARITEDNAFLDSLTPQEFYSGFLGKIGTMGKEAKSGENTTRLVADQLTNQRESVIGVNLDEEAVNLIKYQKAFEASSRVINTTNEILATIVNLGR
jgi:flagellar hook-associated protein 1 FlgK